MTIGRSGSVSKTATLSEAVAWCPRVCGKYCRKNTDYSSAKDAFAIEVKDNKVTATRLDSSHGWSMNLKVPCCEGTPWPVPCWGCMADDRSAMIRSPPPPSSPIIVGVPGRWGVPPPPSLFLPPSPTLSHPLPTSPTLSHPLPPSPTLSHPLPPSPTLSHPLPPSPTLSHPLPPSPTLSHPLPPSPNPLPTRGSSAGPEPNFLCGTLRRTTPAPTRGRGLGEGWERVGEGGRGWAHGGNSVGPLCVFRVCVCFEEGRVKTCGTPGSVHSGAGRAGNSAALVGHGPLPRPSGARSSGSDVISSDA